MTEAVTGSLTGATQRSTVAPRGGKFNVSLGGTWVGTIQLQRSFDSGVTWETVETYTDNFSKIAEEPEPQVKYSFYASAWTSGTANYRFGPNIRW